MAPGPLFIVVSVMMMLLPVPPVDGTLSTETTRSGFMVESYSVIEMDFSAVVAFASVACTVKVNAPGAVGVPDIMPAAVFRVNPAGRRLPVASDQAYDVFPPVASRVWLYATPTVPKVSVWVETTMGSYTSIESG